MASRDIGGSIQAALQDLFAEKAVVEDAIHKLQSLLESMTDTVTGGAPRSASKGRSKAKAATPGRKKAAAGRKKAGKKKAPGTKKASKKAADEESWTGAARKAAGDRMRKYWADRKKKGPSSRRKKA